MAETERTDMDPDATLSEIRELVDSFLRREADGDAVAAGVRLAELAEAMDEWLQKGGHLPADWIAGRHVVGTR